MSKPVPGRDRIRLAIFWALRILLGGSFLFFGFLKLGGKPQMVDEFAKVGFGQWFRYFTGALEVVGGVLALVPRSSIVGSLLLVLVALGAFVAQLTVLHMGWIHTLVTAALLLLLVHLQRRSRGRASSHEGYQS